MEITSPIIAIAITVAKAMFTPLQSSELLSVDWLLVPIKHNDIIRFMTNNSYKAMGNGYS